LNSARASAILPRLVDHSLALGLLGALALTAQACTTPCEDLGRRICACQTSGAARDACDRAVKVLVRQAKTDEQQQDFCDQKLKSCPDPANDSTACDRMNTPAGKEACGLAYPAP
jgi:hypothetical protein